MQARTRELLTARGTGRRMTELGDPARRVTLFGHDGPVGTLDLSTIPSRFDFILMLSQAETERLLEERPRVARHG